MSDSKKFEKWVSNPPSGKEVVITGVSGRFPESHNVHEFQKNLFKKKNIITDDSTRWNSRKFEALHKSGKIPDIDKLDAGYFGIHYRQANAMTPFTRKMLETAVEAVMDAGVNPSELAGSKTGVYIGIANLNLEVESISEITEWKNITVSAHMRSFIANRISYHLKLKGVSCMLDTACSGSLTALNFAYKSIRMGQCDSAIVGGINLVVQPGMSLQYYRLGTLSSEGICKVFDQNADGFVRAEAANCIFLQKSRDARRIYAKILCSKLNCDGFKIDGLTFPSAKMQERLMSDILEESGIDPLDISFMEAHSTGTEVGDSEEVQAIDCAIAKKRQKPLLVGSVKSNMGHGEPASGLCSVIKVIIAMETGYIAPNMHLNNIKKGMLGFEEGRMKVVTELTKLEPEDAIVGINNFGIGGSNGHLVLQRYNKLKSNEKFLGNDVPRLVCVSGRTEKAVSKLLEDVKRRWTDDEYVGLLHHIFKTDIREHLYRGFIIVSKTDTFKTSIKKIDGNKKPVCVYFGKFQKKYKILEQQMTGFPHFNSLLRTVNELLEKKLRSHGNGTEVEVQTRRDICGSVAVQISIVQILKSLNLNLKAICNDIYGKLPVAYYYGTLTLEEFVDSVSNLLTSKESYISKLSLSKTVNSLNCLEVKQNSLVLNFSDKISNDSISLGENSDTWFLLALGRLYEEGYNPQIQNLYTPVQFPVSRGTPMISPSILWDHSKNWRIPNEDAISDAVIQQQHIIDTNNHEENSYLTGHIIDGCLRNFAAEYLHLVWKTFLQNYNKFEVDSLPIVFENCKFLRAITIPKNETLKLLVSIQKESGNFEVVEKNSLVASGRIYSPEDINQHQTDLPTFELNTDRSEILEQDEIYRELHLRGYNYKGLFKGIVKCNSDVTVGLLRWDKNLTAFIDKMLQLKILQMDTRLLHIPVAIQKLSINALRHLILTRKENTLCPVYVYKDCNIVKSRGIEISGANAVSISKKRLVSSPVLEKYLFIPNCVQTSIEESARIFVQIILENSLENNFKAVEILDDTTLNNTHLMPLVSNALNDIPSVVLDLTIFSDTDMNVSSEIKVQTLDLTSTSDVLLVVATKTLQQTNKIEEILNIMNPSGFLIAREELDCGVKSADDLIVVAEHYTDNEKLILLRKTKPEDDTEFVEVVANQFSWISKLQNALKKNSEVIIYGQNPEPEGILGLVNCLRRESRGDKVRCFLMMDQSPKFDIKNSFYRNQLGKQMAINVYKDKEWGTYRHLPLGNRNLIEGRHFFVNNTTKGDLTSLKWIEGLPSLEPSRNNFVYPCYAALNFKDIMIASGRLSSDISYKDRFLQEYPLGLEFSGKDNSGRRVMGVVTNGALSTTMVADNLVLWEIPQNWSLEDASTVPIVYGTVFYALSKVITLKPGMSILIHSATGGIGLAALNICIYHDCDIYVTVGTEEKRVYIQKHFPQILESHIGNSRDTSFEEMIKTETRSRGVDVVLNSLTEDKLQASVRCVASGGHLLELGKYDLRNDESLCLLLVERNVSYHGVMFDRITNDAEELKAWSSDKIKEGIEMGYVKPLPRTVFDKDDIVKAFKYMTGGNHIGKVTVKIRDESEEINKSVVFQGVPRFFCDPEKCYLIVGGLGGFGLELADWLYLRGARKLILVSRFGVQSGYKKQRITNWRSSGVTVEVSTRDVTNKNDCFQLIQEVAKLGTIDAVFNLAVVLKDGLFEDQIEDSFKVALNPKALATLHLDEVTRRLCPELRYFVVFSSVSCGRGNPGQTNYGMANSIMERICERRKSDGLPGLAIQWGAIGDVGLVAKLQRENKELIIGGTLQQKISSCLEALDVFLTQDHPVVSSMVVAEKHMKNNDSERAVDVIASMLGIKDLRAVSFYSSFAELGMDSMMGTETIQLLERDFDIYVTVKDIRNMTLAKLTELEKEKKSFETVLSETKNVEECSPQDIAKDSPMIKLSNVNMGEAITVILLPGVEGFFTDLLPLAENLKAHVLGVHYNFFSSNYSIQEYAQAILPHVEEIVSKQGRFYIIGYSFGTSVAVELTVLLENKGFEGSLVMVEASPAYLLTAHRQEFPQTHENRLRAAIIFKLLTLFLPTNLPMRREDFYKCNSFDECFELAVSRLPDKILGAKKLKKQDFLAVYNRIQSVTGYNFDHDKIKTCVHLFKAKFSIVSDFAHDYQLSELCEQPVQVTEVDGDHVSILKQNRLVEAIRKIFEI